VRRAGLDYWKHIDLTIHKGFSDFKSTVDPQANLWFFTKFSQKSLYEARFSDGDYLIFGKETTGLNPEIHESEDPARFLKIPMPGGEIVRSLNLAGCAHIAVYEALRQSQL